MAVKITSLVDDYCFNTGFLGEHGLSMLLETPGGSLLLDTGSSGLPLEHNAAALDIDLSQVDAVAVTHGHRPYWRLKDSFAKSEKHACLCPSRCISG